MTPLRAWLKNAWFGLRGVDPEAVVVTFATGPTALVREMYDEARRLMPERRHFLISTAPLPGLTSIVLPRGSTLGIWLQLWRRFRRLRIGMAPVLFGTGREEAALRRAAILLAPGKILAYNPRIERHHLQARCWLASILFLRGVPLDRIWLRPRWFGPLRRETSVVPDSFRVIEGRSLSRARGRVAVLTPFFPYPLSHGGAVRLYSLLRLASMRFDIFLFSFVENETEADFDAMRKICARIWLVSKPRYREPRWSTVAPPEVREYEAPVMRRIVGGALREFDAGCLQVEFTQLAAYGGQILVEHDLTQDLYRQVFERDRTLARWWDWWRWRRFERRALARAPVAVFMSGPDAQASAHPRARVIPNGVDVARFLPSPEPSGAGVLFIGSFRHFPNVVAYRFLIEEVWARLRKACPDVRLTVVAGPESGAYWRQVTGERDLPATERVRLLDFIPDVRPLYDDANIVVVPALVSAGTNLKVLEAMAMGRAIVSTTVGCAGLEVTSGVHLVVADGADAFLESMIELAGSPELRRRLGEAARKHVVEHYSWERIALHQCRLWEEFARVPLAIRPAHASDLETVRGIQARCAEAARWPVEDYLAHQVLVGEMEGGIAGFVVVRETGAGEREVLNLAVAPEKRSLGVGSQLVLAAIEGFSGAVHLEVRESNKTAQKLYRKLGFQVACTRPGYYENPTEPGIVMTLQKC